MSAPRSRPPAAALALLAALAAPTLAASQQEDPGRTGRREIVIVGPERYHPRLLESFARRGFLGVQLIDLTAELRAHWGLPPDRGVLVSQVVAASPAAQAGVAVGDFVTAVDGDGVRTASQLAGRIGRKSEGDTVRLQIQRRGSVLELEATLTENERPQLELGQFIWRDRPAGAGVVQLDPEREVEVITVDPESVNESVRALMERLQASGLPGRLQMEASEREELERRIAELEQRLQAMERLLQEQARDDR